MSVKTKRPEQVDDLFMIPEEFATPENFEERCNFLAHDKDPHETAIVIMDWIHNYFQRWVPAINRPILDFLSQQKIYRYELPHNFLLKMGNCGLVTTVFNLFCHLSGITARRVSFWGQPLPGCEPVGHTLAEVNIDGRWMMFDPSTNIYWDAALADIVADPDRFRSDMHTELIDKENWQQRRLWAICNEQLYANIRKIEYLDVKPGNDVFEFETQPRVADYVPEGAQATSA